MADPGGVYPPPSMVHVYACISSMCAAMNSSLVSYPDPLRHSCGCITSPLRSYVILCVPACLTIETQDVPSHIQVLTVSLVPPVHPFTHVAVNLLRLGIIPDNGKINQKASKLT